MKGRMAACHFRCDSVKMGEGSPMSHGGSEKGICAMMMSVDGSTSPWLAQSQIINKKRRMKSSSLFRVTELNWFLTSWRRRMKSHGLSGAMKHTYSADKLTAPNRSAEESGDAFAEAEAPPPILASPVRPHGEE